MTQQYQIFDENGELITVEGDINDILNRNPMFKRMKMYNLNEQLNYLYDDIKAGLFGEAAKSGSFVAYLDAVKSQYPKE
jgi:hypothetical protein